MKPRSSHPPNTYLCTCESSIWNARDLFGSREKDRNRVCCCGGVHWVITGTGNQSCAGMGSYSQLQYGCRLACGAVRQVSVIPKIGLTP